MAYCVHCGAEYSFGDRVCAKCAGALPVPAIPSPETRDVPAAGRLKRCLAGAVDGALAAAIIIYFVRVLAPKVLVGGRGKLIAALAVLALPAIYLLLRDAFGGKSLGKLFFGITTYNREKRRVAGIADSLLRNVVFGFVAIPYVGWGIAGILGVFAGFQILAGRRQRIGDGLAATIVVDDAIVRELG